MKEMYPDEDFVVIGEIGICAESFNSQDMLLTDYGKLVPIFPRGSLTKPFEWIAGYIAVGENTYVAVVKSIFPPFLHHFIRVG